MWVFTRYGFYSIACASKSDGSLDNQSVMVRARCIAHLRSLQKRFPALAVGKILDLPNHDYRYRLVIPKASWVAIIDELAQEQEWSNFNKFKIKPDKGSEFRKWAAEDLHKFAQSRVDSGAITTWDLLRSVDLAGESASCDYLSVSMYPGAPTEPMGMENLGAELKKAGMHQTRKNTLIDATRSPPSSQTTSSRTGTTSVRPRRATTSW